MGVVLDIATSGAAVHTATLAIAASLVLARLDEVCATLTARHLRSHAHA